MAKRKGGGIKLLVFLGVIAGGAYGAHAAGLTQSFLEPDEEGPLDGAPVRRGDLRISEVVRGNLEAQDSAEVRNELEGRSTIIYLIPEGTRVEKGDLVAELDVADTERELTRQQDTVRSAELEVTKAQAQYEIQEIENETDLAAAQLALDLARLDLEKYLDEEFGDWSNELKTLEETIVKREEELAQAEDEFNATKGLHAEGFATDFELNSDRLRFQSAEIALEQARRDRAAKLEYGNRREVMELNAEVENKERNLKKVEKQSESKLADYDAARDSAQDKLELESKELERINEQLGKSKIYAPETGLVVYARESSRWGSSEVIEEGQEVRERQQIISIPREGGMTVKASIHETKLKKIQRGQPCLVEIDAFPNRIFNGRVDFVAVMADSGSWRSNPNQRLYKADITLIDTIPEMRPGMSANVEILIDDLSDVLYIPRQCVQLNAGSTIVFVQKGEEIEVREIEVGLDNAKWVEVKSGLTEGEIVLLAPPATFEPEPAPETDEAAVEGAKAAAAAAPAAKPKAEGAPSGSGMPDMSKYRGADGKIDREKLRKAIEAGEVQMPQRGSDGQRPSGGSREGGGRRGGGDSSGGDSSGGPRRGGGGGGE